jgi:hypothetical protein
MSAAEQCKGMCLDCAMAIRKMVLVYYSVLRHQLLGYTSGGNGWAGDLWAGGYYGPGVVGLFGQEQTRHSQLSHSSQNTMVILSAVCPIVPLSCDLEAARQSGQPTRHLPICQLFLGVDFDF